MEQMYLKYVRVKCYQKNKTTPKTKTEDKDKTTPKTKTEDKDMTAPKTRTKTEIKIRLHLKLGLKLKIKLRLQLKLGLKLKIKIRLHQKLGIRLKISSYRCFDMQSDTVVKTVIGQKDRLSLSFGMTSMYLNYVKSGYAITINMHTHGLKSFAHIWVMSFLVESIRQPHQKINQTLT